MTKQDLYQQREIVKFSNYQKTKSALDIIGIGQDFKKSQQRERLESKASENVKMKHKAQGSKETKRCKHVAPGSEAIEYHID